MKWIRVIKYLTLAFIVLVIGYAVILYLIHLGKVSEDFFIGVKGWGTPFLLIIGSIIALAYLIYKLLDKKEEKETPKEFVDVEPALQIWREQFIINCGIPFRYDYEQKPAKPVVLNKSDLHEGEIRGFNHPKTGNPMVMFEVTCRKGKYLGVNTIFLQLDAGKEYIKNNWRKNINPNTPINAYKNVEKEYPLDTPQTEEGRLNIFKAEKMAEGYTQRELKYLDTLKTNVEAPSQPTFSDDYLETQAQLKAMEEAGKLAKYRK